MYCESNMIVLDGVQRYPQSSMCLMASDKAVFCLNYLLTCTWVYEV